MSTLEDKLAALSTDMKDLAKKQSTADFNIKKAASQEGSVADTKLDVDNLKLEIKQDVDSLLVSFKVTYLINDIYQPWI